MPEIDNLLGSTRRVVEEQEPLNNCRGVTYRVVNVDGGSTVISSLQGYPKFGGTNTVLAFDL